MSSLIAEIDALLPQTQCRQCGYAGCRPYAAAIASGAADINQCPPGGDAAILELAALLGVAAKPLDTARGAHKPRAVALIDEPACIGCTLCIQACPVDAVVGAAKLMHTVIASLCTGCELCIPVCPVDCISLREIDREWRALTPEARRETANRARDRYESRQSRREREKQEKASRRVTSAPDDAKKAAIAAAFERARARRAAFASEKR